MFLGRYLEALRLTVRNSMYCTLAEKYRRLGERT